VRGNQGPFLWVPLCEISNNISAFSAYINVSGRYITIKPRLIIWKEVGHVYMKSEVNVA